MSVLLKGKQITQPLNVSGSFTGSFTGSFFGNGSGLTNLNVSSESLATTGSNTFIGNQTISGSLTVTESIYFPNLTEQSQNNIVVFDSASGQLYYTSSAAITNSAVKAGYTTTFEGTPYSSSVIFDIPFPNNLYSVSILGDELRSWSIQSKTSGSFIIQSNSSVPLSNSVYWIATSFTQ